MEKFQSLFEKIGFKIKDENLLFEAFTHRSAVNEYSEIKQHNERLEFLGDAVLELISTDFLFRKFTDIAEGELTNLRSALVRGEHLSEVARKLDLGSLLLLSKGEQKSGGAEKDYLLANLVEAFIGAIYLDLGIDMATKFVKDFILSDLDEIMSKNKHIDSKSEFQELSQGKLGITPHYEVLSESGLDHEKTFVMATYLDEKKVGVGQGRSKKEAQLNAATDALNNQDKWLNG